MKKKNLIILIFLLPALTFGQGKKLMKVSKNNSSQKEKQSYVFCWKGFLYQQEDTTPVFLHYQIYDSLPGMYHKYLVAGKINYLNSNKSLLIAGYVQKQTDTSIHLNEFGSDGTIRHAISAGSAKRDFQGYFLNADEEDIQGVLSLTKSDSTIPASNIEARADELFGHYHYQIGKNGVKNEMDLVKIDSKHTAFRVISTEPESRGYIALDWDTVMITKNSFIYDAKAYGVIIYKIKVALYKSFAVVSILSDDADDDSIRNRATLAGFYIKTK